MAKGQIALSLLIPFFSRKRRGPDRESRDHEQRLGHRVNSAEEICLYIDTVMSWGSCGREASDRGERLTCRNRDFHFYEGGANSLFHVATGGWSNDNHFHFHFIPE